MLNIIKILSFIACVILVSAGHANAVYLGEGLTSLGVPMNLPFQSQIEMRLCMIRRAFCGPLITASIAISVFIIGMMVLHNKMHWSTAMIIVAGIVMMVEANSIVAFFGNANTLIFIGSPFCKCGCQINGGLNVDLGMIGNWIANLAGASTTGCD